MWGEPIGELWDLERLSEVCAEQKVRRPLVSNVGPRAMLTETVAAMVVFPHICAVEYQRRGSLTAERGRNLLREGG